MSGNTVINQYVSIDQFKASVAERFGQPVKMPTSTIAAIATDYPAADWPGASVYLSDGVANKFIAVSNGVAWYYANGTAV